MNMRRYVFEVVIHEGSDEFWEDIDLKDLSGCDAVSDMVHECFRGYGLEPEIKLVSYTNTI